MTLSVEERKIFSHLISYYSFVDEGHGCWLWKRGRTAKKYGGIGFREAWIGVHRLSYAIFNADFDDSLLVLHRCDVPMCCNPDHLFLGDSQANMDDMYAKGREPVRIGTENPKAKLVEIQVLEIRRLYKEKEFSQRGLANLFNVSRRCIVDILANKNWSHI